MFSFFLKKKVKGCILGESITGLGTNTLTDLSLTVNVSPRQTHLRQKKNKLVKQELQRAAH